MRFVKVGMNENAVFDLTAHSKNSHPKANISTGDDDGFLEIKSFFVMIGIGAKKT